MTNPFSGTYAALLTGFSDDGEFDAQRQRNLLDYVTAQDVNGLYVGGSSGEDGLMDVSELIELQNVVAAYTPTKPMTLIAHVGRPSLNASIKLAKNAEKQGYQALSALPPHAYPFSDEEIIEYYRELCSATELPMIAYEIPVRTQRALPLDVLGEILNLPNVIGIKFTSTDFFKMSQLRANHPDKSLFFGYDEIAGAAALLGTDGGIGTTYNILGSLYTALFKAVEAGNIERARELQSISQRFVTDLLVTGVFPGMKLALQHIGVDCGPSRKPFTVKSADGSALIKRAVERPDFAAWIAKS